jgi:hypothetical protein
MQMRRVQYQAQFRATRSERAQQGYRVRTAGKTNGKTQAGL